MWEIKKVLKHVHEQYSIVYTTKNVSPFMCCKLLINANIKKKLKEVRLTVMMTRGKKEEKTRKRKGIKTIKEK